MRKIIQNPVYLIVLGALALIMVLFISSTTTAATCASEESLCQKPREPKGSPLLWESFSLQFVPSVSSY